MNRKTIKRINKQTGFILVDWLKTLVSEEEAKGINIYNYKTLLPEQTHVYLRNKFFLSVFCERWVRKKLKQLKRKHPQRNVEDFTLADVSRLTKTWQTINR
jgi:hypothetical protein|tara:strand:- start:920 stop:1222 length:303 start_codon:yes stop_codon:yes gene_type:complete